jgi:hypothetical protein
MVDEHSADVVGQVVAGEFDVIGKNEKARTGCFLPNCADSGVVIREWKCKAPLLRQQVVAAAHVNRDCIRVILYFLQNFLISARGRIAQDKIGPKPGRHGFGILGRLPVPADV